MKRLTHKPLAIVGILTLLAVVIIGALPVKSAAATLSSGSYTFLLNGEEIMFPVDPVARKDGLLFPEEVFARFGISLVEAPAKTITLTKGTDVTVTLTVGSTAATINEKVASVATAPLRLAGRLFLPADILKEFGVETVQDGTMLLFRTSIDDTATQTLTDTEWQLLRSGRTINTTTKADSGAQLTAEYTFLTPDIVKTTNLGLSYGARARLLSYLQTNSVVLVKLSNYQSRSGGIVASGLYLVDNTARTEYDFVSVLDLGSGLLNNKLAPGADRIGALVFPKIQTPKGPFSLYYDTSASNLGTFVLP